MELSQEAQSFCLKHPVLLEAQSDFDAGDKKLNEYSHEDLVTLVRSAHITGYRHGLYRGQQGMKE